MKTIILFGIGLLVMTACAKEEALVPSEIKNRYEIKEKSDMDAIDQKIYDIWKTYEIGVWYTDTLGYEDSGRKNPVTGEPIYVYDTIGIIHDIGIVSGLVDIAWTRVDVSTSDKKSKLLPLLNFLDEKLLKFVEESHINIPAIFITQNFTKGTGLKAAKKKVYRGFDYLIVTLEDFNEANKNGYWAEFIAQAGAKKIENYLTEYYLTTEAAIAAVTTYTPWGTRYAQMISGYNGTNPAQDPKNYGFLGLIGTGSAANLMAPNKSEDLNMYLLALLNNTMTQLEAQYAAYPLVIKRFKQLKEILLNNAIDIDELKQQL